jgi:hypothetical protein
MRWVIITITITDGLISTTGCPAVHGTKQNPIGIDVEHRVKVSDRSSRNGRPSASE